MKFRSFAFMALLALLTIGAFAQKLEMPASGDAHGVIGPFVPPGELYDNETNNGTTSLASQDSSGTFGARTADDFNIPGTGCTTGEFDITGVRFQIVQNDATPQAFAIDIYADDGTGTAPVSGINPIISFPEVSQANLGPFGAGTSMFEGAATTSGLVLDADTTYWISAYGTDGAANAAGFNNFFAASNGASGTMANGVIIAPDAGVPDWTAVDLVIGPPALAFSFAIDGECRAPQIIIPTLSPLGMVGLLLLMVGAAFLMMKRRRQAPSAV